VLKERSSENLEKSDGNSEKERQQGIHEKEIKKSSRSPQCPTLKKKRPARAQHKKGKSKPEWGKHGRSRLLQGGQGTKPGEPSRGGKNFYKDPVN